MLLNLIYNRHSFSDQLSTNASRAYVKGFFFISTFLLQIQDIMYRHAPSLGSTVECSEAFISGVPSVQWKRHRSPQFDPLIEFCDVCTCGGRLCGEDSATS